MKTESSQRKNNAAFTVCLCFYGRKIGTPLLCRTDLLIFQGDTSLQRNAWVAMLVDGESLSITVLCRVALCFPGVNISLNFLQNVFSTKGFTFAIIVD